MGKYHTHAHSQVHAPNAINNSLKAQVKHSPTVVWTVSLSRARRDIDAGVNKEQNGYLSVTFKFSGLISFCA